MLKTYRTHDRSLWRQQMLPDHALVVVGDERSPALNLGAYDYPIAHAIITPYTCIATFAEDLVQLNLSDKQVQVNLKLFLQGAICQSLVGIMLGKTKTKTQSQRRQP